LDDQTRTAEGGEGSQNNIRFSKSPMQLAFSVYNTIETNLNFRTSMCSCSTTIPVRLEAGVGLAAKKLAGVQGQ
jgi:hypothetical protein